MGFLNWFTGKKSANTAQPVRDGGGWVRIDEPFTGAWQRNQEITVSKEAQLGHHAVFACVSLITRDVGKLKLQTKKEVGNVRLTHPSRISDLIAKPNNYQTTQQFFEAWATSKASNGNTYVWKVRNIFGEVWQLKVLNPERVKPLIDPNGNVFYQIRKDKLFNLAEDVVLPASEIIHDRFNCFYHQLVGLSPITACALSASQGINIQRNANRFFANASRPSGIITVPGPIDEEDAKTIRKKWKENYTGLSQGETAVMGDGAEYKPISVSAHDAELVEQLKLSGEVICTAFSVPAFKIGLGTIPAGQKVGDLNEIYYSDCLQHYLESIENLLNAHLDLEDGVETEFNLKALLRMDASSQMAYLKEGVGSAIFSPNEARAELGYPAVTGGESPMIQQQNYSLAAIAKRDASDAPFSKAALPAAANDDSANEASND